MTVQPETNKKNSRFNVEEGIFYPAAIVLLILALWGLLDSSTFGKAASAALGFTLKYFGSGYLLVGASFLFFIIFLAVSPIGRVRIGGPDAKAEFTYIQWFSMALCAGIAIGILFWGVAEPLYHYYGPPTGLGIEPKSASSARFAMRTSWLHWALHPYGFYCLFGVAIAYFTYNRNLPFRLSSTLYPLIGDKIYGPFGKLIDSVSIIAIIGAIATSLGFGTMQLAGGLEYTLGIKSSMPIWISIIVLVTICFTLSSYTGLKKGIKWLSQQNMRMYVILLCILTIVGPTFFLINFFTQTIADYIGVLIPAGLLADPFAETQGWVGSWTIFYWAWWIAAAPVVGMFLARVGYGRTIREFIFVNLLAPAVFGMIWFTVFGGTALYMEHFQNAGLMDMINKMGLQVALFGLLGKIPLSFITIPVSYLAVAASFITLADSMTSSIAIMTTKGNTLELQHQEAPAILKITWGVLLGGLTIALLLIGTLQAVQSSSIVLGVPIAVIGFACLFALLKEFFMDREEAQNSVKDS